MKFAQNFFLRSFARVSPVFASAALVFAALCFPAAAKSSADPTATVKRHAAEAQFSKAEEQRAALNSKSAEKRTLAEYKLVVASYRKVYLITPHAADVQDSLLAVGELYTEMGDRFGRTYYQSAVDSYQFLLHEYPKSRSTQDVLLRIAKLQRDQLGDSSQAMKTYQDFLKRFPHSENRREAQEALAELSLLQTSAVPELKSSSAVKNGVPDKTESARKAEVNSSKDEEDEDQPSAKSGNIPTVKTISSVASGDSTRITIALENSVQWRLRRDWMAST